MAAATHVPSGPTRGSTRPHGSYGQRGTRGVHDRVYPTNVHSLTSGSANYVDDRESLANPGCFIHRDTQASRLLIERAGGIDTTDVASSWTAVADTRSVIDRPRPVGL